MITLMGVTLYFQRVLTEFMLTFSNYTVLCVGLFFANRVTKTKKTEDNAANINR